MAKKKMTARTSKAAAAAGSTDKDIVAEAYRDGLKLRLEKFFISYALVEPAEAAKDLANGLDILRRARDHALKIV
jgi:hypothetical protein